MPSGMTSPVFAGRDDELAALADAFEAAAGGTPRTVLVGGDAGSGKSRLAGEFSARVRGQRAGELAGLLPEFGAAPSGADPDTARARLFELLLTLLESLAERQPLVMVIEDVHWADRAT